MISLSAKTKGGRSPSGGENGLLGGDRKFWPMGGAKIWPDEKKLFVWPASSRIFYLNQKQKSYVTLKSGNSKFLKNMVAPPPL